MATPLYDRAELSRPPAPILDWDEAKVSGDPTGKIYLRYSTAKSGIEDSFGHSHWSRFCASYDTQTDTGSPAPTSGAQWLTTT